MQCGGLSGVSGRIPLPGPTHPRAFAPPGSWVLSFSGLPPPTSWPQGPSRSALLHSPHCHGWGFIPSPTFQLHICPTMSSWPL